MTAPSIADELAATARVRPCIVGAFIDTLEPADRVAVKQAIGQPRTAANVWRVLTRRGMSASSSQVRIHARRECRCPETGHDYEETPA